MSFIGIFALAAVFVSMFALGMRLQPQRLMQEMPKFGLVARCLLVALIAVPLVAIALGELLGLSRATFAGLLLVGVSPGAPMALRQSHDSGGQVSFAMVLQVAVAVLAILAVPAWVWIVHLLYRSTADIGMTALAQQVTLAQLLPLGCGAAFAIWSPARANQLSVPLLKIGGGLVALVALVILWQVATKLPSLGPSPFIASILLTLCALGLGHIAGGPSPDTRTSAAAISAMRNPGIALLVASTNHLPETATLIVIAHAFMTAVLLAGYLALRRARAARRELADSSN